MKNYKVSDFNQGDKVKIIGNIGFALSSGGTYPPKDSKEYPMVGIIEKKSPCLLSLIPIGYSITVNGYGFRLDTLIKNDLIEKIENES